MSNPTALDKFKNLQSKMHQAVEILEKVKKENSGVLPEEYSRKAHQVQNALEDLKQQAIRSNI